MLAPYASAYLNSIKNLSEPEGARLNSSSNSLKDLVCTSNLIPQIIEFSRIDTVE